MIGEVKTRCAGLPACPARGDILLNSSLYKFSSTNVWNLTFQIKVQPNWYINININIAWDLNLKSHPKGSANEARLVCT